MLLASVAIVWFLVATLRDYAMKNNVGPAVDPEPLEAQQLAARIAVVEVRSVNIHFFSVSSFFQNSHVVNLHLLHAGALGSSRGWR